MAILQTVVLVALALQEADVLVILTVAVELLTMEHLVKDFLEEILEEKFLGG